MIKQTKSTQNLLKTQFYRDFVKTSYGFIKLESNFGSFILQNKEYLSLISIFGELPPNIITFYRKPDFKNFETYQEMNKWLEKYGSYPNKPISKRKYEIMILKVLRTYTKEIE